MHVKQFFDDGLAHGSYAILSDDQVALVDPGRDPRPYESFAEENNARIVAIFETHPHADFASSHMEFYRKYGLPIYVNPKMQVDYPHQPLDDGETVPVGRVTLKALFTPGHSPDHNTYLLQDEAGNPSAVFTGDSLFVGDIGRPDLREGAGKIQQQREELAQQMYQTMRNVFRKLPDEVMVYPAHGKGSLCGKNMSSETYSTIGKERERNWALQVDDEQTFVNSLLEGQPYIPKYFPYEVAANAAGLKGLAESLKAIPRLDPDTELESDTLIVDTRSSALYKQGHHPNAISIPDGSKFETWLGSLISPEESFYLVAQDEEQLETVLYKAAKIGYEQLIKGALLAPDHLPETSDQANPDNVFEHPESYTIIDVRDEQEVAAGKVFDNAVNIPLNQLRDKASEVNADKPIAVHCAGGYRSGIGASILEGALPDAEIHDISERIRDIQKDMQ